MNKIKEWEQDLEKRDWPQLKKEHLKDARNADWEDFGFSDKNR